MGNTSARKSDEKEQGNQKIAAQDGEALRQLEPISTDVSYRPPDMSPIRRRAVMFALCMTLLLGALDVTIIATALPTITSTLHATASEYAWVGSAYTLSSTASTPVWAKMSDIFGRKSTIMVAAAIFMVGSLIAALAKTIKVLIAGRTVQGLGGGGSLVLVTILIGDIFKLEDRAKYYVFINLPFDGVALLVLFFTLKVETPKEAFITGLRELDWIGFALIIGGTICFLYGLETGAGGVMPWDSAQVICLVLFGVIILALFVCWEACFARNPVIPFRIFKKATNIASFALSCLHSFVFISYDYFLPLYFQVVLGFRPIIAGVTIFALLIPLTMMTMLGGLFTRRTGNYIIPIFFGSSMMTLGNGLFINFQTDTQWAKIIVFQMITGFGAGVLFQSPMISIQTHTHQRDMAAAMSAFSFLRSLFSSMSIVIGTVLLQHNLGGGGLTGGDLHSGHETVTAPATDKGNYISALRVMWAFFTAVSGCMLFAALFIKPKPTKPGAATGDD
ncbi:efflux pump antibiotic resistance [Colletotrichum tofieldiae]|nr:efflux pump antibiotic resistance [Colletotrichum tofieldiae]